MARQHSSMYRLHAIGLVLALLSLLVGSVQAQSNVGTSFVVVFMSNRMTNEPSGSIELVVDALQATATVQVSAPGVTPTPFITTVAVTKGTNTRVQLPLASLMLSSSGSSRENKAIFVTSSEPVSVFAYSLKEQSSSGMLVLPTTQLATDYAISSYPTRNSGTESTTSRAAIVALEDNSVFSVDVTNAGTVFFDNTVLAGSVPQNFTLNRGQVVQMRPLTVSPGDLSSVHIHAYTSPVAVFSGHDCAWVPTDRDHCDALAEQLPPQRTFGRSFVTGPFISASLQPAVYRVYASAVASVVSFFDSASDSTLSQTVAPLNYVEFTASSASTSFVHISATNPVMVAQYMEGSGLAAEVAQGDPAMTIVPPVEQFLNDYRFATPRSSTIAPLPELTMAVNVAVPTAHTASVRLNGAVVDASNFTAVGTSGYAVAQLRVPANTANLLTSNPLNVPLGAIVYGWGNQVAFAHPAGQRLIDLTATCVPTTGMPRDGVDNDCDGRVDEEILNGIDDDLDGTIDEDLAAEPPVVVFPANTSLADCAATLPVTTGTPSLSSEADVCVDAGGATTFAFVDSSDAACPHFTSIVRSWTATDGCGNVLTHDQYITPEPIVILTSSLPTGTVTVNENAPYSVTPTLATGTLPVRWSLVTAATDMTIDASTGAITWSAAVGNQGSPYSVAVTATNNVTSDTVSYSLSVRLIPVITNITAPQAALPTAAFSLPLTLEAGTLPVSWSLVAPFPAGMTITTGGVVQWPAPTLSNSPHTVIAEASNSAGSDTMEFVIEVGHVPVFDESSTPFPSITIAAGVPYSQALPLSQGTAPITWLLLAGPTGAFLNSSTGVFTWDAPTLSGSPHSVSVSATNDADSDSASFSINVLTLPFIDQGVLPPSVILAAVPFTFSPSLIAGTQPVSWALDATSAPLEMSIDSATGELSWPSPTNANLTLLLTASNLVGQDSLVVPLLVQTAPAIDSASLPSPSVTVPAQTAVSYMPTLLMGSLPVTWSLASAPQGMTINAVSGTIDWSSPTSSGSPHNVTVVVANAIASAHSSFNIVVNEMPIIDSTSVLAIAAVQVGNAFSMTPIVSDGTPPISWSLSGAPAGMTIDSATAEIQWTPTTAQGDTSAVVTITATSSVGFDTASFTAAAYFPPLLDRASFPSSPVQLLAGQSFALQPTVLNGSQPLTWSLTTAPTGMTINSVSGAIAWSDTQNASSYTVTVSLANLVNSDAVSFTIDVLDAPVIDTASLPTSAVNVETDAAYSLQLGVERGSTPITWTIDAAGQPTSMTIGTTSGLLEWTPATSLDAGQTYTVTINAANAVASDSFTLTLNVFDAPLLNASSLPPNVTDIAFASSFQASPSLASGTPPFSWSLSVAPAGMTIHTLTGAISWLNANSSGANTVTVLVQNPAASNALTFTLNVLAVPTINIISVVSLASVEILQSFSMTPSISDGTPPISWSLSGAPAGMTIDSATAEIQWTPTTAQGDTSAVVTITATNSVGFDTASFTAAAYFPPLLDRASFPSSPVQLLAGQSFALQPTVLNGSQPLTWSLTTAPTGMTINSVSGAIAWSDTQNASSYTVTVSLANLVNSDAVSFTIDVLDAPVIDTASLPSSTVDVQVGVTYSLQLATSSGSSPITWRFLQGDRDNMTLDATSGLLEWTPSPSQADILVTVVFGAENPVALATSFVTIRVFAAPIIDAVSLEVLYVAQHTPLVAQATLAQGTTPVTYNLTSGPTGMTVDASTGEILWNNTAVVGDYAAVISVTNSVASSSLSFTVRVLEAVHIDRRGSSEHNFVFYFATPNLEFRLLIGADQGSEPMNWSLERAPTNMTINSTTGELAWVPQTSDLFVNYEVAMLLTNPVSSNSRSIIVAVREPPELEADTPAANLTVERGQLFTATLVATLATQFTGVDYEFSLPISLPNMTVDATSGVIEWPNTNVEGVFTFTGRVSSLLGHNDRVFSLVVAETPRFVAIPSSIASAIDEPFSLQLELSSGSPPFRQVLDEAPTGMTLSETGLLQWLSPHDIGSPFTVRVSISNAVGGDQITTSLSIQSRVAISSLGVPTNAIQSGSPYTLQFALSSGTPPVAWSLLQGPPGALLASDTGLLVWTVPSGVDSPYNVTLSATNDVSSATLSFLLTVLDPPAIDPDSVPSAAIQVTPGSSVSLSPALLTGTSVTWSLANTPPFGVQIDVNTGAVQWLSATRAGSPHVLTIVASNGIGTDSVVVVVEVRLAPVIAGIPDTTVHLYENFPHVHHLGLVTGGVASWSLDAGAPAGLTIVNNTGLLSWPAPQLESNGEPYTVSVTASNAVGSDTQSFNIVVETPPSLNNGASTPDMSGTTFYVVFSENHGNVGDLYVLVAAQEGTDATVTVTMASQSFSTQVTASALGTPVRVDLPSQARASTASIVSAGVHIASDTRISVVAFDTASSNGNLFAGSFAVLPSDVLGTDYRVMAYGATDAADGARSQFTVMATQDNTTVTVVPPSNELLFINSQVVFGTMTVTLNAFETIAATAVLASPGDVTGSIIFADRPLVVVGGHQCAQVPRDKSACNLLAQQIPPIRTWGTEVVTQAFSGTQTGGDMVRVLTASATSSTQVSYSINGATPVVVSVIGFVQFALPADATLWVGETSSPREGILVAQFAQSASVTVPTNTVGAPVMALVPPVEQWGALVSIALPQWTGASEALLVYSRTAARSGVLVNNTAVSGWTTVGTSDYSVAHVSLASATGARRVTVRNSQLNNGVGVVAYGLGNLVAYGYSAGFRLSPVRSACVMSAGSPEDGLDNDCDGRIDEEIANGIDDDNDGRIDEDLVASALVVTRAVNDTLLACSLVNATSNLQPSIVAVSSLCVLAAGGVSPSLLVTPSTVPPNTACAAFDYHLNSFAVVDGCGNTFADQQFLFPAEPIIDTNTLPASLVTLNEGDAFTALPLLVQGTAPTLWTLTNSPADMAIDAETGALAWTPASPIGSPHTVEVNVANDAGSDTFTFVIVVRAIPVFVAVASPRPTIPAVTPTFGLSLSLVRGFQPVNYTLDTAPAGMTIDRVLGEVVWTSPTQVGSPHTVTARATNSLGSDTVTFLLPVQVAPTIDVTGVSDPIYIALGSPWTFQLSAGSGTAPLSWFILSGAPAGMTINNATGRLSWPTPATQPVTPFAVTVSVGNDAAAATIALNLAVEQPPIIDTDGLPATPVAAGVPFTLATNTSTGDAPLAWTLLAGPAGMTASPSSGEVSWPSPTSAGSPHMVLLNVRNRVGASNVSFSLVVHDRPTVDLSSVPSPSATATAGDSYELQLSASGGTAPLVWSLLTGPPGMTINATSGLLTLPVATSTGSPYTVEVSLTNDVGITPISFGLVVLDSLSVSPPAELASTSLLQLLEGNALSLAFGVGSGSGTLTWSVSSDAPGLTIDSSSGLLSWPSAVASATAYTTTVTVVNAVSNESFSFSMEVFTQVRINSLSLPTSGVAIRSATQLHFFATTTSGTGTITWSLASAPSGMTISGSTGETTWPVPLSSAGTPYNVTFVATNPVSSDIVEIALLVHDVPTISTGPADTSIATGSTLTLSLVTSSGSSPLAWSLESAPAGMVVVEATGALLWPTASTAGSPHTVRAVVRNDVGNATTSFVVTVLDSVVFDSSSITGLTAFERFPLRVQAATSAGTGTFTWSLSGAPSGMTIDATTGLIEWLDPRLASTPYTFTVGIANDVSSDSADGDVLVTDSPPLSATEGVLDNVGDAFLVAFMPNRNDGQTSATDALVLDLGAFGVDVQVNVTSADGQLLVPTQQVLAGSLTSVTVPSSGRMSEGVLESKGILVSTSSPVSLAMLNTKTDSSDGSLVSPSDTLGFEYYVVAWPGKAASSFKSMFGVVALDDDTTIAIHSPVELVIDGVVVAPFTTTTVDMESLKTLSVVAQNASDDVTGTRINANRPVAVYGGHECASVPLSAATCSHLVEQLPPTTTWGKNFYAATATAIADYPTTLRIFASSNDTTLTVWDSSATPSVTLTTTLAAGEVVDYTPTSGDADVHISTSNPVLVAQFLSSPEAVLSGTSTSTGGASMLVVTPHEQGLNRVSLPAFGSFGTATVATVFVATSRTDGILVNNAAVATNLWTPVGALGTVSVARVPVTPGATVQVSHSTVTVPLSVSLYGLDSAQSYFESLGSRFAPIASVCTTNSASAPANGLDDDCDGRIDEELFNGLDDDGDGRIDEDLAIEPLSVSMLANGTIDDCNATPQGPVVTSEATLCVFVGGISLVNYTDTYEPQGSTCLTASRIVRTWTVTDGCGNTRTQQQVLDAASPGFDPASVPSPSASVDEAGTYTLQPTVRGTEPFSWSLGASAPAGMTIDSATGAIEWTGATTDGSPYNVTLIVSNVHGTATASFQLIVRAAPVIDSTSVPSPSLTVATGKSVVLQPAVSAGFQPVSWSLTAHPAGMTIDSSTGAIAYGSASSSGSPYAVTIVVGNSVSSDSLSFVLFVLDPPQISSNGIPAPQAIVSSATEYTLTPQLTAGTGTLVWSLPSRPSGMRVDSGTGVVTWPTPTATAVAHNVTLAVTNGIDSDSVSFQLLVLQVPLVDLTSLPYPNASIAAEAVYSVTPALTTGTGSLTWALNVAPNGMTINPSTGTLEWPSPTTVNSPHTVDLTVTNEVGSQSISFALIVVTTPSVDTSSVDPNLPPVSSANSFTYDPDVAVGGTGPFTYSLPPGSGAASGGLTIHPTTGVLSWSSPSAVGSPHNITVVVSNAVGADSFAVYITVLDPPVLDTTTLPDVNDTVIVGVAYSLQPQLSSGTGNITWQLPDHPAGMIIDPLTGMVNWTNPQAAVVGRRRTVGTSSPYTTTIAAVNAVGNSSHTFLLVVSTSDPSLGGQGLNDSGLAWWIWLLIALLLLLLLLLLICCCCCGRRRRRDKDALSKYRPQMEERSNMIELQENPMKMSALSEAEERRRMASEEEDRRRREQEQQDREEALRQVELERARRTEEERRRARQAELDAEAERERREAEAREREEEIWRRKQEEERLRAAREREARRRDEESAEVERARERALEEQRAREEEERRRKRIAMFGALGDDAFELFGEPVGHVRSKQQMVASVEREGGIVLKRDNVMEDRRAVLDDSLEFVDSTRASASRTATERTTTSLQGMSQSSLDTLHRREEPAGTPTGKATVDEDDPNFGYVETSREPTYAYGNGESARAQVMSPPRARKPIGSVYDDDDDEERDHVDLDYVSGAPPASHPTAGKRRVSFDSDYGVDAGSRQDQSSHNAAPPSTASDFVFHFNEDGETQLEDEMF